MIRLGRVQNIRLGHGDSAKPNLLAGTFGEGMDTAEIAAGFAASRFLRDRKLVTGGAGGGGKGSPSPSGRLREGCVDVASYLPSGQRAGQVVVGDTLVLLDPATMQLSEGRVVHSERVEAIRYQVQTHTGGLLICSSTAPLPVQEGPDRHPGDMCGQVTPVSMDGDVFWDQVVNVRYMGMGYVQLITMEGPLRYFLAGEFQGAYLAHHNAKLGDNAP